MALNGHSDNVIFLCVSICEKGIMRFVGLKLMRFQLQKHAKMQMIKEQHFNMFSA